MADIFRSAINYLSGGTVSGGNSRGSEFIGQTVHLDDGLTFTAKNILAEGGFGFVYAGENAITQEACAIKRQIVPAEYAEYVQREIRILKNLKDHPHIIQFIGATGTPLSKSMVGSEFIIVTELATGQVIDIIKKQTLSPVQVLHVFYETCLAISYLHECKPPIIHRDIKVENLLVSSRCQIKLCDFGSATTERIYPDKNWTALQRAMVEEEIARSTTPCYRAPEMIDLYSNKAIGEKVDIWALGCLLYFLCYRVHPFEDGAKLRILNADFGFPQDEALYVLFHQVVSSVLVVEPEDRPSVDTLVAFSFSLADSLHENLDRPSETFWLPVGDSFQLSSSTQDTTGIGSSQTILNKMRDGAGSLLKNIKEGSGKVMAGVHMPRQKLLDISYVTSRVLVMSFPHEDYSTNFSNSLIDASTYLNSVHPSQYLVFNLSGERYNVGVLHGQVVDFVWPKKYVPPLESILEVCHQCDSWLKADDKNIIVIHCKDGFYPTGVLIAAYFIYLNIVPSPTAATSLFCAKRFPQKEIISLSSSEKRYLGYISQLVESKELCPHTSCVTLLQLEMSHTPLYNTSRNGCTPYVEIFVNEERVYTSCSKDSMNTLRTYYDDGGNIVLPLHVTVQGNVLVVVHHIQEVKSVEKGMSGTKMLQLQFHTGFLAKTAELYMNRNELDGPPARNSSKFSKNFRLCLKLQWQQVTNPNMATLSLQNILYRSSGLLHCFSTLQEQEEIFKLVKGLPAHDTPTKDKTTSSTRSSPAPAKDEDLLGINTDTHIIETEPADEDLLGFSTSTCHSNNSHIENTSSNEDLLGINTDTYHTNDPHVEESKGANVDIFGIKNASSDADLLGLNQFLSPGFESSNTSPQNTSDVFNTLSFDNDSKNTGTHSDNLISLDPYDLLTKEDSKNSQVQNSSPSHFRSEQPPPIHNASSQKMSSQPLNWPSFASATNRSRDQSSTEKKSGVAPRIKETDFDDLLQPGLFSRPKQSSPTAMNQMKQAVVLDPVKAKVRDWAEGKEHNVRALLSSLHTILWEGETRWKQVGMHQLVEPDQVAKFFRKACLSVHPDKAQGKEHESLARAIFDELNEAYELFQESGSKSLYLH